MALLVMVGCQNNTNSSSETSYEVYYRVIEENTSFKNESDYYTISGEMVEMDDGTYRYYIIIDEPKVTMYDVIILMVEDDIPYETNTKMMPSSGIFEKPVCMVPNQVNTEDGFVKGIVLSGETNKGVVKIEMVVEWQNSGRTITTRDFISFNLNVRGIQYTEGQISD